MAASSDSNQPSNKWAIYGFTTTPEERNGPGPPYTYPGLQVNLFFRVFLGLVSLFVTWVPARLLWRNGEFGGTVLCVMLLVLNVQTVINALIWRNNNVSEWWAGQGWCDIQAYTNFALHSAFNISLFEIMRSLAGKVALNRAVKPSRRERRRQRIVSAFVIFTFPVTQVILSYFSTISRYNISTLVGCSAVYYPNWIYLVFYILPTPAFAVGAAFMAGLTFYRYRKIDRVTRDVARSQDGIAAARQERVRKKLYFMTLVAIILVLPLIMVLLFRNIVEGAPWNLPYDLQALHFGSDPFNVYFISFTTSDLMDFPTLSLSFIGLLAGIATFIPFGSTPEALNMYRELLLAIGLGYVFPRLREEYHTSPRRGSTFTWASLTRHLRGRGLLSTSSNGSTRKDSLLPTIEQVSLSSRVDKAQSPALAQPRDFSPPVETIPYPDQTAATSSTAHRNPWPDLSAIELDNATAQIGVGPQRPSRNPFALLPGTFAKPPVNFPSLSIPSLSNGRNGGPGRYFSGPSPSASSLGSRRRDRDETRTSSPPPSQPPPPPLPLSATSTTAPHPHSRNPTTPWCPDPNLSSSSPSSSATPKLGVDTRIWARASDNHGPAASPHGSTSSEARIAAAAAGGVRIETSIARRSMDIGEDGNGDSRGELERGCPPRRLTVKVDPSSASSAAS